MKKKLTVQQETVKKARGMALKQRFNFLVKIGIYTKDKKLTKVYGGEG